MDEQKTNVSDAALRTIASHCAVAGLCPLIPIPFVDDLIVERVHRRMNASLCAQHEITLLPLSSKLLAESESDLLNGALKGLLMWPIKKLLRKVLIVFALKNCVDVATEVFHEGWLLARALEEGYVDLEELRKNKPSALRALRHAIVMAREEIDPDMTRQVMRSAFDMGGEVFTDLVAAVRKAMTGAGEGEKLDAAAESAAPLTARLEEAVREQWSSGEALDAALRDAISRA
jgi:hypothetical protein